MHTKKISALIYIYISSLGKKKISPGLLFVKIDEWQVSERASLSIYLSEKQTRGDGFFSQVYPAPCKFRLPGLVVIVCWLPFSFWFRFSHNASCSRRVLCTCTRHREVSLKPCPETRGLVEEVGGNKTVLPEKIPLKIKKSKN